MKDKDSWQPTKFEFLKDRLRASRNVQHVGMGSRLTADILAREYQKVIARYARGILLDLGCGKVPLYACYKKYVADIVCVDWQSSFHLNPHLDYVADLNHEIPVPDDYCDTILATDLIEHIYNPHQLWKNMSRVLKRDGIIIIGTPFLYPLHEEPYDYYRYTEYSLRMLCESNGLAVIELYPYGGTPEVISDIVCKHLRFSKVLAGVWITISTLFIRSYIGRYLSQKTSRKFPLGYILVAQRQP